MPDICDLILDDHEVFRRRFAEMDELRRDGHDHEHLARVWAPLADRLESHAAAEEELFYPRLLQLGQRADDETTDAIGDHNAIRDAIRRATRSPAGTNEWWEAVLDARAANSDHMAEEERGAIPDYRTHDDRGTRRELGDRWEGFRETHAGPGGVDITDKDPARYVHRHGRSSKGHPGR